MKKIIFLSLAVLLAGFIFVHESQSQIKSYYSGDAINHNNRLYVASTDSGALEILKLEDKNLQELVTIRPYDPTFNSYSDLNDVKLISENGRLFAYAVGGYTLYKYELLNDRQLVLIASRRNTYWEWYARVDSFGNDLVTVSSKGVKVWNTQIMDVVESIELAVTDPYNVRANGNDYILNIQENSLEVYDRALRTTTKIALNYKSASGNRQAYQDDKDDIYVVDDYYTKKFSRDGRLLSNFRHLDYNGYDTSASGHTDYFFFSNGLGVVKLHKESLAVAASQETVNLAGARGWAMGLKTVYLGGDKIVVFNNSNILVLDDDLKLLADHEASEATEPLVQENLYLKLDHIAGTPGAIVKLNGGGYLPGEALSFNFGGIVTSGTADSRGRFNQSLLVPDQSDKRVDIKVTGQDSGLTYSIAFSIQ